MPVLCMFPLHSFVSCFRALSTCTQRTLVPVELEATPVVAESVILSLVLPPFTSLQAISNHERQLPPSCRYQVQLVGHSLGGGIAALSACILTWDEQLPLVSQGTKVTAMTFASPPVLVRALST